MSFLVFAKGSRQKNNGYFTVRLTVIGGGSTPPGLTIGSSDKLFRIPDFFSEKIIVGPHEGEIPPPLAQMVLTQCTSIPELLVHRMSPPGGQI